MIDTRPMKSSTNRKLHLLLTSTGLMDEKEFLVSQTTEGRTSHSSDMNEWEAQNLIAHLQQGQRDEEEKCDKMRKKILGICHSMGWYGRYPDGELIVHMGKPVLDFPRINAFCKERGNAHKPLQEYNRKELTTLVTIFENVAKSEAKK